MICNKNLSVEDIKKKNAVELQKLLSYRSEFRAKNHSAWNKIFGEEIIPKESSNILKKIKTGEVLYVLYGISLLLEVGSVCEYLDSVFVLENSTIQEWKETLRWLESNECTDENAEVSLHGSPGEENFAFSFHKTQPFSLEEFLYRIHKQLKRQTPQERREYHKYLDFLELTESLLEVLYAK